MIARLLLFLLIGLSAAANAQPTWRCVPDLSTARSVTTPAGDAYGAWCSTTDAAGVKTWVSQRLYCLTANCSAATFYAATKRIAAAPDKLAAVNAEMAAAFNAPSPGTQAQYEADRLLYLMCLRLAEPPLPAAFTLPANWCGAAPVAPTPAWVVAKAGLTANPPGTRPSYTFTAPATLAVDGKRVAQDAPCDCARTSYTAGLTRYCGVDPAVPARVAVCVQKATP